MIRLFPKLAIRWHLITNEGQYSVVILPVDGLVINLDLIFVREKAVSSLGHLHIVLALVNDCRSVVKNASLGCTPSIFVFLLTLFIMVSNKAFFMFLSWNSIPSS